jgi:hypothetical protein
MLVKEGEAPGKTRDRLSAMNIDVPVSRSPRAPALDLSARGLDALVRASVHFTTTNRTLSASFGQSRVSTQPHYGAASRAYPDPRDFSGDSSKPASRRYPRGHGAQQFVSRR